MRNSILHGVETSSAESEKGVGIHPRSYVKEVETSTPIEGGEDVSTLQGGGIEAFIEFLIDRVALQSSPSASDNKKTFIFVLLVG